MADAQGAAHKAVVVAGFLKLRLEQHRRAGDATGPTPPLVVGVQGPQGAGKSFMTSQLPDVLATPEYGCLRTATLSLDDLYLTHSAQQALSLAHPDNALLQGRGPPGTHDMPLALSVCDGLHRINAGGPAAAAVRVPVYDKAAFGGRGDRSPGAVRIQPPVDVVIFEGWMVGFRPLAEDALRERYAAGVAAHTRAGAGVPPVPCGDTHPSTLARREAPFFVDHPLRALLQVNRLLQGYEALWDRLDAFVELRPRDPRFVWSWRLEQEHQMKKNNGGRGMSDEEVGAFIARYMPCYELLDPCYGEKPLCRESSTDGAPPQDGRTKLRLLLDQNRNLLRAEWF